MMNWRKLMTEPRIIIALLAVIAAVIFMKPAFVQTENGTYGLETDIKRGLDLQGGVRALVLPEDQTTEIVQKAAEVLSSRISAFGLQEAVVRTVTVGEQTLIEIELAGSTEEQLQKIIERQGKFEAKVDRTVDLENGEGILLVDDVEHQVSVNNGVVSIDGNRVGENETVLIEGVPFEVTNVTETEVDLFGIAMTGADVTHVFKDPQRAIVGGSGNNWGFQFTIAVDQDAARRFEKIVKNSPVAGQYLESQIHLILDDNPVDVLSIGTDLRTGTHTQVAISGGATSKEEALENMKQLQSILSSGALPTAINVEQITTVSPTLGEEFMKLSLVAIFGAIVAVSIVIFIRYKDPKLVIPIILTSSLEVVIIFGVTALINATIDLAAIAGIIAAIGTGVDNQILIADETHKRRNEKEELSAKAKIKAAFFVIFAAAATTGAAMIPLMIVGAGAVKGFALTTLIGVAIGILITRPAFAKIVEYLE